MGHSHSFEQAFPMSHWSCYLNNPQMGKEKILFVIWPNMFELWNSS